MPNEDNQDPDDDVKIEIIKTREDSKDRQSPIVDNKKEQKSETNFDATKALDWKDGVGSLPGSSLKVYLLFLFFLKLIIEDHFQLRSLIIVLFFKLPKCRRS